VHNSFARELYLELDIPANARKDDNFHFVTYVPAGGRVYELDGLRDGPVAVGPPLADGQDWLEVVKPHIRERIQRYSYNFGRKRIPKWRKQ
jgi:ubiquitin carboxyl-terminal hydrolase L5